MGKIWDDLDITIRKCIPMEYGGIKSETEDLILHDLFCLKK